MFHRRASGPRRGNEIWPFQLFWYWVLQQFVLPYKPWRYFQLEVKWLVKVTCGRVLLSLSTKATEDSLCSMQDDGIVMHHHTSVSCSKVCSNTSTYLISSIIQYYYSYNICFMTNTFYFRKNNINVDSTIWAVALGRRWSATPLASRRAMASGCIQWLLVKSRAHHRHTHDLNEFIICPIAIAYSMGQIIKL